MLNTVFTRSEALLDIGETGRWKGTNFFHTIDARFGNTLVTLLKENKISSMTDLGCGTGGYIKMITDAGIFAHGFDGNPKTEELDVSGGLCVGPVDITNERTWNMTDAAMSIEVAEHIPAQFEDTFLKNLVGSARELVILSWGFPGQPGEGHVNGKTAEAVEQKMKERGWEKNDGLTGQLKMGTTAAWIKRNVQVYSKEK